MPSGPGGAARAARAPGSLRDLLTVPSLRLRLVSGTGPALERTVRWVHTTELPDPARYLRGGELVCTVGVSLTEPASCRRFVAALVRAGAAGLCFGVGDVHPAVPPALVEACSTAGLPLLELPEGAPFVAVSERLADSWAAAAALVADRERAVLAAALDALAAGATAGRLLEVASDVTGGTVTTLGDGDAAALDWRGAGDPPSEALLAQLGRVVAAARAQERRDEARRRREVGRLLGLVEDGLADPRALLPLLEDAGLAGEREVVVAAWPAHAGTAVADAVPGAVLAETDDLLVTLSAGSSGAAGVAAAAYATALPCGLGATVPLARLPEALADARAALAAAPTGPPLVDARGLPTFEALLRCAPTWLLAAFVDQLVRPVLAAGPRQGGVQVATLRAYVEHDGALQATAEHLGVHVNTVRHRLDRVRAVTGRDPLRHADLMAFAAALWAVESRRRGVGSP